MMDAGECPFCAELIRANARKCWHCGQSLGPPMRESALKDQKNVDEASLGEVDDFVMAYLRGVDLRGAYLSRVDLFSANLVAADLRGADLGGANLCNADLTKADLSCANLFGADLSDAGLGGADLRGADLREADLSGAQYDDYTLWPEGFDPGLAGAVHAVRGR